MVKDGERKGERGKGRRAKGKWEDGESPKYKMERGLGGMKKEP
jgi:hypothetical protein